MKYFLDTNIIIYFMNGKYPEIVEHLYKIPEESIVIPSIVKSEIEYGARKSSNYKKNIGLYNAFLESFEVVDFDSASAIQYGKIRHDLEKIGKLIGGNDMLIASMVLSNEGVLVTHNTKEFERIEGLKLEDWC